MKNQSSKDKMDEKLGMKHGKESSMKESMKARRHESEGMHKKSESMKMKEGCKMGMKEKMGMKKK